MKALMDQTPGTNSSSDREQALVRLINCSIVVLYTAICYLNQLLSQTVVFIYLLAIPFSIALIIWATKSPEGNHLRRITGMLADLGTTTAAMCISGEAASPLFVIFLWTTFGNGFRYGKEYLYLSMCLSIVGFSLVLYLSPFWSQQMHLGVGLLLTLSVLPIYIAALLRRLQAATAKAEQASLAKSQFLASMSHELRTPLNGVVGMSDMLNSTRMTREQKEFSSTIQSSSKTLLALIENILDFSKIEAGKTELEEVNFDLHELLHSIVAMLFPQAEKNGVTCKLHVAADVPFRLKGDSIHLRQILINLLGNAVKFTEKGSIELNIFTVNVNEDQVRLRFEVIDTGIGMSQEEQALIFENFTQADQSISRRFGGTGLGTTISRKLVELMNGTIGVISETHKGSKFWFELEYDYKARYAEYADEDPIVSNSASMLLISTVSARVPKVEQYLEDWGFEWNQADNVEDAFIELQSAVDAGKPYDVVLIDHRRLGNGNMETNDALALRIAADPRTKLSNLILISHRDMDSSREVSLLSAGYFCILKAPVEKRFLFNALHATSMAQSKGSNVTKLVNFKSSSDKAEKLDLLVGEDNTTNQKVIRTILEYAGHTVDIFENGNEILDAIEEKHYDMIILDMHMPEMDGIETAKALRFIQTGNDRRPIIMLTADATVNAINACEEADIDVYLTKPVESEKLLSSIAQLSSGEREINKPRLQASREALNLESLEKLSSLSKNPDFMPDLIDGFISDTKQLISGIEAAIGQKNFSAVHDQAHAIKGSASNIGATSLALCAAKIVSQSQKGVLLNLPDLFSELNQEFEKTISALNGFLEKNGSAVL